MTPNCSCRHLITFCRRTFQFFHWYFFPSVSDHHISHMMYPQATALGSVYIITVITYYFTLSVQFCTVISVLFYTWCLISPSACHIIISIMMSPEDHVQRRQGGFSSDHLWRACMHRELLWFSIQISSNLVWLVISNSNPDLFSPTFQVELSLCAF